MSIKTHIFANMRHIFLTLLCAAALLLSCEKPINGYVIPTPNKGNSQTQPQKPSEPENPTTGPEVPTVTPPSGYVIVGYATYWDKTIPNTEVLTHICYAFAHIKSDFETLDIKEPSRLKTIANLKSQKPALKVLLSVGGWGAGNFSEMAASETHRKKFAQNCLKAVNDYKLDGIDIDWEYPGDKGGGISYSSDDKKNYTLLIKELRTVLGTNKLLTMASAANAEYVDFPAIIPYLDFVNVMTYDMGEPPYHNAALYKYKGKSRSHYCEGSVELHQEKGVPNDKIVLGMAFFGRDGDKDEVDFNQIDYLKHTICWDDEAKVPYLTDLDGNMTLSYDNERSITEKAKFVKQQGLKGAMYWNLEADYADWTLSKAIARELIGWVEPAQEGFLATNTYVEKYLEAVDYGDTKYTYSSIGSFEGGGPSENNIEIPPTYTITWAASSSAQTLTVKEGDWSRTYSLAAGVGKQDITNLVPNTTYTWTVKVGNTSVSSGSFKTRGLLHQVYFEPNVRNGRDLGGWKGLNGKTIAYHKLYRGGAIHKSRTSDKGKADMRAEGIRAEVDLRETSSVSSLNGKSPLGDDIAFYAPEFEEGYNEMIKRNTEKVKKTFMFIVQCLRDNKPVYFHCSAGRDRTGTLAVLLEGALGMSESDMAKDFELTYFSPADWSMYKDIYQHTRNNSGYKSIRETIYSKTSSGTYQERIVQYLLGIGVPQKDIDDLRTIMLK